jgi:hypothetical protein
MEQQINRNQEYKEVKKLSYVIVILSVFVIAIFGLAPFA